MDDITFQKSKSIIRLMHGDCLDRMKEIDSGSVDMVLADPPYGTTACKWDSIIPLEPMWEQLKRVVKKNGAIVMTASQPFTSVLIMSNIKEFKYNWVWEKNKSTGYLNAKKQPMNSYEVVSVFYSKQCLYNPIMGEGKAYSNHHKKGDNGECYGEVRESIVENRTSRYPKRNIQFKVDIKAEFHPTQKPVALMEYMVKTYTNPGDTVLDFTMGSGTTGVACVCTGRNFIGIELDDNYFNIAKGRIGEGVM